MLGHDLRLKGPLAISGNVERQLTKIALKGLGAVTITCIARRVGHGFTFAVAKMFSHFDFQCALYQHLGQLFEQHADSCALRHASQLT